MTFSPPAVPVFPAGYGPLPADFNAWVQATLGFQSDGVIFRAEQHTAQAFAAGTTIITYDTVLEDPFSGWNAGSHQWLAPFTGLYRVTLTVVVNAVSTVLEPGIEVSGTTFIFSGENQVTTLKGGASGSLLVPLIEATDFVQGVIAVSAAAVASTVNGLYSTIEISYESQ
jgi:hypothetical protein